MTREFCDRYRERRAPNRQMLAVKGAKVDQSKWEPISFDSTPPRKIIAAEAVPVILEDAARRVA